jgi:hypothetical protein
MVIIDRKHIHSFILANVALELPLSLHPPSKLQPHGDDLPPQPLPPRLRLGHHPLDFPSRHQSHYI